MATQPRIDVHAEQEFSVVVIVVTADLQSLVKLRPTVATVLKQPSLETKRFNSASVACLMLVY